MTIRFLIDSDSDYCDEVFITENALCVPAVGDRVILPTEEMPSRFDGISYKVTNVTIDYRNNMTMALVFLENMPINIMDL